MWPLAVVLGWPMLEIALFVVIGGEIGLWATLAWVVVSALLGMMILRLSAARQAVALRGGLADLRDPARLAAGGMLSLLGGVLLILPGFFSDAVGLVLLLPPVQAVVARRLQAVVVMRRGHPHEDDIIDGDYTEAPPPDRASDDAPSGWKRLN